MRTVKFRGKDIGTGKWVEGCLLQINNHYEIGWQEASTYETEGGWEQYEVQSDTIGQFTGLTDINGNEIYEGDIVQCGEFVYEVGYANRFASFVLLRKQDMFAHYFGEAMEANECEVIGNIHDNPELLKGSQE